jgi:hypothetical protein
MIEYAIAAEFDNTQGTCIVGSQPKLEFKAADHLLADYLIPDGMHRVERDVFTFRSVMAVNTAGLKEEIDQFNELKPSANLYVYKSSDRHLFDEADLPKNEFFGFSLELVEMKFMKLCYRKDGAGKAKYFMLQGKLEIRKLSDKKYSIRAEDEVIYVLEFQHKSHGVLMCSLTWVLTQNCLLKRLLGIESDNLLLKAGWFLCCCSNQKSPEVERGTLFRSIAIFSSKIQLLTPFFSLLNSALDNFIAFPPKPQWRDYEHLALEKILNDLVNLTNEFVAPQDQALLNLNNSLISSGSASFKLGLRIGPNEYQPVAYYPRLYSSSLRTTLDILGVNTMVLYRAILQEKNIAFYAEKLKVQLITAVVNSMSQLLLPLNVVHKICPFEHIQSLNIVKGIKGFLAGFSNPIVKSPKSLNWDLLVDLNSGLILNQQLKQETCKSSNDKTFIEVLLVKIKQQGLEDEEIEQIFQEYTRLNIAMLLNKGAVLGSGEEDEDVMEAIFSQSNAFKETEFFAYIDIFHKNEREEFKEVFNQRYLGVYQAYKVLSEGDKTEDIEIMMSLDALLKNLTQKEAVEFLLEKLVRKTGGVECLLIGMYSADHGVKEATRKLLALLQGFELWNGLLGELSLFNTLVIGQMNDELGN